MDLASENALFIFETTLGLLKESAWTPMLGLGQHAHVP